MAVEMFIKLDGVTGDSADPAHKDEIEVLSFHWDVSNPASGYPPPLAATSVQPSIEDFSLRSAAGTALPPILLHCMTGEHIREGLLTVRRADRGTASDYLVFRFSDIIVTRVEQEGFGPSAFRSAAIASGMGSDATRPSSEAVVTVSLNFARVTIECFPESRGGRAATPATFSWDFAKGAAIAGPG